MVAVRDLYRECENMQALRGGSKKGDDGMNPEAQNVATETGKYEESKRKGLKIFDASTLKTMLKPTSVLSFINPESDDERIDFVARRLDLMTVGAMSDTMIVRSLTRMKTIQDMQEKDIEGMSKEDLAELFNVDLKIDDMKNNQNFQCITDDPNTCLLYTSPSPRDS